MLNETGLEVNYDVLYALFDCIEYAIDYWGVIKLTKEQSDIPDMDFEDKILLALSNGQSIKVKDIETGEKYYFNLQTIVKALDVLTHQNDILDARTFKDYKNWDVVVTDAIIQYALFGELVFG